MRRLRRVLLGILLFAAGTPVYVWSRGTTIMFHVFASAGLLIGLLWLDWWLENKKGPRPREKGARMYIEPPSPEESKGVKRRASLRLAGEVGLTPEEAIAVIRKVAKRLRPVSVDGAHFSVLGQTPARLELVCNSGDNKFELFTLSAEASTNDGKTTVRVGGLETYTTSELSLDGLGLIPIGAMIMSMEAYRYFLKECKRELVAADAGACLAIARVK